MSSSGSPSPERTPAADTVAICISTYRRPEGLRGLLQSLDGQVGLAGRTPLRVAVVDNDPEGSAAPVLDWARDHTSLHLVTAVEERPGVSYGRNRSVALAQGATFIAIIDDDMTADPHWLASLLAAQQHYQADVVGGHIERSAADDTREWMTRLELFDPMRQLSEGDEVVVIDLANCLLRRDLLGEQPFDPALGSIGGEDSMLCARLNRAGRRIVVTRTARTHEVLTPERTRIAWIARRAFRLGSSWAIVERAVFPSRRSARGARSLGRIGRGLTRGMRGVVTRDRRHVLDGLVDVCAGSGGLAGLLGLTIGEYRRDGRLIVRVHPRELAA